MIHPTTLLKQKDVSIFCFKVIVSSEKPSGSSLPTLGMGKTYHLSLILTLLPDVTQHVSELGLLLVHFI